MYRFPVYPTNWKAIANSCKERDGRKCTRCGKTTGPLHAHHIISKSKGGSDSRINLRTLCEECHTLMHPHMKQRRSKVLRRSKNGLDSKKRFK